MLIVGPITPGQVDLVLNYVFFFSVSQSFAIASGSSVSLLFCNVCRFIWFQVSFLLGTIPVIAAWIYSEYLEYYKNVAPPKVYVSYFIYLFVKILSRFFFLFFGLQFCLIYERFIFKILIRFKVIKWWNISKEIRRKVFELFFMSWALNFLNL